MPRRRSRLAQCTLGFVCGAALVLGLVGVLVANPGERAFADRVAHHPVAALHDWRRTRAAAAALESAPRPTVAPPAGSAAAGTAAAEVPASPPPALPGWLLGQRMCSTARQQCDRTMAAAPPVLPAYRASGPIGGGGNERWRSLAGTATSGTENLAFSAAAGARRGTVAMLARGERPGNAPPPPPPPGCGTGGNATGAWPGLVASLSAALAQLDAGGPATPPVVWTVLDEYTSDMAAEHALAAARLATAGRTFFVAVDAESLGAACAAGVPVAYVPPPSLAAEALHATDYALGDALRLRAKYVERTALLLLLLLRC